MPGIEEYTIYKEFGVAALFIVMYVTTVWFLIRTLVQDRAKEVKRTEKLAELIATSNVVWRRNTEILEQLKLAIEREERRALEFLVYVKARNDVREERREEAKDDQS